MTNKILVGDDILNRGLLRNARKEHLKCATYNLTIGEIIPIGRKSILERRREGHQIKSYFIEPREMIFVLSEEEFTLPGTVTALASLRATLTKKGLLAFNVGFIDPFFKGPISAALLNFSDRPVEVKLRDEFFRVIFFEHDDVEKLRPENDESINKKDYINFLEIKAYSEFPRTYLKAPVLDSEFYKENFSLLLKHGLLKTKIGQTLLIVAFIILVGSINNIYKFIKAEYPIITNVEKSLNQGKK